jgi:mono/diheme cytochrome c family protein
MPPCRRARRLLAPLLASVFLFLPGLASALAGLEWLEVSSHLGPSGAAIDFTPHGTQPGLFHGLETAQACSGCHGATGDIGEDFRPYPTWAGSMMANATRDPLFWAALDVANHDVPGVGDYCLRCHTSRGWYGGRVVKSGFGGPNNDVTLGAAGCLLAGTPDRVDNTDNDYGGLPCHFCHRLSPEGPGGEPTPIGNANAWLDDEACPGDSEPCRRGPYDYTDGASPPPHAWQYSEYHTQSAICGLCHDVTTPDTDIGPLKTLKLADGTDTGLPFPIERTYSEWAQSDYADTGSPSAQTCQSCHMPISDDPDASACSFGSNRTGNLPVHAFVGGNTWIPGIIKGEFSDTSDTPGAFGGIGREDSFDQTVEWARQLLGSAAALDTTITAFTPPTGSSAGTMNVNVKVTNLSGHKLPSGYSEGRRMWLNVQVRDANGALVFESGAYDAANAILTVDAQARVYETLQGIFNHNGTNTCDVIDGDGNPLFHFVLSDCIAKDNRIPPLGFEPATAADPNGYELRPVGATYPETSPGSGILVNYDNAAYTLDVPAGTPLPLSATARLYYQTSSREYIEFLRDQAIDNGFAGENQMCSGEPNRPFVVGPQDRSRGEYMYQLWNDDTLFAHGFDSEQARRNYGKSPPELMQVSTAITAP